MGHSVSKGRASRNEHLVRDIAYLRDQTQKQEKALNELQKEHDAQTEELENVKEENEKLKNALKLASVSGGDSRDGAPVSQTVPLEVAVKPEPRTADESWEPDVEAISDTDSGVNVERGTYLKVGDKVLSLHKNWSYYTATIVHFDADTCEYTVDWDDGDPTGRIQKYCDVAIDKTPPEDEIGIGTVVLFPQVRNV